MINHQNPVSPILPTDTAVESGHVVPGLAGGDAEADIEHAGASDEPVGPAEQDQDEVLPQTAQASPDQPTASQVADHELTHLHYRAWCRDCVETFGRERAHHALDPAGRMVPLIATERGVQLKDEVEYDWESAPDNVLRLLAGVCSKTGDYFMHAVPKKGLDARGYSASCLSKSVLSMGHARCVLRSDNEPAMLQIVKTATGQVRLGGVDIVDEGSTPHDPQTNGRAEAAVKLLKGLMNVHKLSFERRLQRHIPPAHPLMTWLVGDAKIVESVL